MLNCTLGAGKRVLKAILRRQTVPCLWSKSSNWGDALTPHLVSLISGRQSRYEENPFCWKHLVIGSIMERADAYSIVWGAGMIAADKRPGKPPHAICAVRGPLTREKLLASGISCPEVYGDPALLMPRFYNPRRTVKWKLGVIPHHADRQHPWIAQIRAEEGLRVIDVCTGIEAFINEVLACERILSSSLHGLICADAYGVPNRRMVLGNELIGGDFKFFDYYGSMSITAESPVRPQAGEKALDLLMAVSKSRLTLDLDQLMNVCPFRSNGANSGGLGRPSH